MKEMFLYVYDCGWVGAFVCVAESREAALIKFKEVNKTNTGWWHNVTKENFYEYPLNTTTAFWTEGDQ